jgi:hypothetical protein
MLHVASLAALLLLDGPTLERAHKDKEPIVRMEQLSLSDRCRAAGMMARTILSVIELRKYEEDPLKEGRLDLFFSRNYGADIMTDESIFKRGESCGPVSIKRVYSWSSAAKPLAVVLWSGKARDLSPDRWYLRIDTRVLGPDRWEFKWRIGDDFKGCDRDKKGRIALCPGRLWVPLPLPDVKVIIAREPSRRGIGAELEVESAVIELLRFGSSAGFQEY